MRKTELIAHVLINAGFNATLEQTELKVRHTFEEEFPDADFHRWNSNVPNGEDMVKNIGKQDRVNVRLFIQDLWNI